MADCQIKPTTPIKHINWLAHYALLKRPDVIVCIGDFADMASLYDDKNKLSYEGRRYKDDIESAVAAMQTFVQPFKDFNNTVADIRLMYKPELHFFLGNHEYRIIKAQQQDPKLAGTLSIDHLRLQEMGWRVHKFIYPEIIDGVAYSHYFPSGPKGLAISSARKMLQQLHMSAVCGHVPGRDIAYDLRGDGTPMTAIISGSFYSHDEHYVIGPQDHWRGFYMLHEVRDGAFDEMAVSLNYLAGKAKKEGWK